ncbi:MAG: recombination protein RecR [Clostridia bacterium]|nr:recombination protein RecR [Clostridia bacterium]MBQ7224716.1 recombination protein RecR [Clostridia bacterium]MBR7141479.1 recombination protein RecR [Clostridia bacterium]
MRHPDAIQRLINRFCALPGVGQKTAQRYAYAVVNMSDEDAKEFAEAIVQVKEEVKFCSVCGNLTDKEVCDICSTRDNSVICVVAQPKDILSIERVAGRTFVYHVLGGTLNPLEGKGPNELRIKQLLGRLDGVKEVIIATNPDVEGEATAVYLARLLKPMGIKVTRIAQGVSMGSEIEYADEVTLTRALESRTEI